MDKTLNSPDVESYVELTSDDSLDSQFEVPFIHRHLGNAPDIAIPRIRLYLGNKPTVYDVEQLYRQTNRPLPSLLANEIYPSHRVYVLRHSIGIVQEGGWQSVRRVGHQVRFSVDDGIQNLDVFPDARYIKRIDGHLNFEAALGANGELVAPTHHLDVPGTDVSIAFGGKMKAATDNSIVGTFSFAVIESEIQAIGKNNTYAEWIFNRTDTPLYGSDIDMYQTILVDKFATELKFEHALYAVVPTLGGLWSSKRQGAWSSVTINLQPS